MKNQNKPKNLLLLITLALFLSSEAFAQNSFYGKIYYGISDAAFLIDQDVVRLSGFDAEGFRGLMQRGLGNSVFGLGKSSIRNGKLKLN